MTDSFRDLDAIDRAILKAVSSDGRITVTELAKAVGLSTTPCQVRLKRLIDDDFIQGFKARLNPAKMHLERVTFVEVRLSNTSEKALMAFNRAVVGIPEIEQCHMIAGGIMLKCPWPDVEHLRLLHGCCELGVVAAIPKLLISGDHFWSQDSLDAA